MKTQDIFIAHPKNTQQINALKAFMQALEIKFETTKEKPYNSEFVDMILQADKDFEKGKGIKMTANEFKALCK
jgi:hypothetical protein